MATEQSCGGVVYTYIGSRRHYVVVIEQDGHTSLPKGHMEEGETPRYTALREIREETGIRAALHPDVMLEETYPLRRGGEKHVCYFLAYFSNQSIRFDPTQVRGARLLPLQEALRMLTFEGARSILLKADALLEGMQRPPVRGQQDHA